MNKQIKLDVYNMYDGHCAYCGKNIDFKDMQVDHIKPKRMGGMDDIKNFNPACRQCNHYKRAGSLVYFRSLLITLHNRVRDIYICKVAEDYRIIKVEPWDGTFYFEKLREVEDK